MNLIGFFMMILSEKKCVNKRMHLMDGLKHFHVKEVLCKYLKMKPYFNSY